MERSARIYVAGHTGLAGSAILRALQRAGYSNLVLRRHAELELTDARAVDGLVIVMDVNDVLLAWTAAARPSSLA